MTKRIISVQLGARRNYAVPTIIARAEMLEAFYTDMCADCGIGAILDRYCPPAFRVGVIGRLLSRRLPPEIRNKVVTFDTPALRYQFRQQLAAKNQMRLYRAHKAFSKEFSQAMINMGLGQATHILSMFGEGIDLIKYAKEQDIKIITDIYLSFSTNRIVQAERLSFPGMEPILPTEIMQAGQEHARCVCNLTDVFIVPSHFVTKSLAEFGVDKTKYHIVHKGVADSWFQVKNTPKRGRILFVGSAELRKGIHILGMAARMLSHRNYEFRVVGRASGPVRRHEITQRLDFVGHVPRAYIQQEYSGADILVLPTLAEGSAEVTYEALAVGLPVITTEAAGSVVRDGIEGFIVPERGTEALAARIEELVEDRALRERMANAAKERAKDYTWDKYAERLVAVFQTI
jgi:glycosyltransferase involved in cell wall biosynthesis